MPIPVSIKELPIQDQISFLASRMATALASKEQLKARDEKGYSVYVHDMLNLPTIVSADTLWRREKGRLYVNPGVFNSEAWDIEFDSTLSDKPWYQSEKAKPAQLPVWPTEEKDKNQLVEGFPLPEEEFKSLGAWGPNPVVEVGVIVLKEDGKLYLEHIARRAADGGQYALVGGNISRASAILEGRIEEFLEERYSGGLFTTACTPDLLSHMDSLDRAKRNDTLVNMVIFAKPEINAQVTAILSDETLTFTEQSANLQACRDSLPKADFSAFDHDMCVLKCKVYKEFFPVKWKAYVDFMKTKFVELPVVERNGVAPGATAYGFYVSHISYAFVSPAELAAEEAAWGLKPAAGDDAAAVYSTSVERLFAADNSMASLHPAYLLKILADCFGKNPGLVEQESIRVQMQEIMTQLVARLIRSLASDFGVGFDASFNVCDFGKGGLGYYMTKLKACDGIAETIEIVSQFLKANMYGAQPVAATELAKLQAQQRDVVSAAVLSHAGFASFTYAGAAAAPSSADDAVAIRRPGE